jgi:hypothetical protein
LALRVYLLALHPFSKAGSVVHHSPSFMVLDYSSLFMVSVFLLRGDSVCIGAKLIYASRGWVGESHMVPDAQLFILSVHKQAGLVQVVVGRNVANFSQCSSMWGEFPWARGS